MPSIAPLFSDPDEFFSERVDDPSYKGPIAVMLLIGAIGSVSTIIQFRAIYSLFTAMETDIPGTVITGISAISFVFVLIGPFIGWLMWAGGFVLVSVFLDGNEDFSTTLALVGWGFVPKIFSQLAALGLTYYQFEIRGVSVPENFTAESSQQFVQQLTGGTVVVARTGITILFLFWSAFIWYYAVQHSLELDRRDAAITVAVPLLLAIVWNGQTLLTAL